MFSLYNLKNVFFVATLGVFVSVVTPTYHVLAQLDPAKRAEIENQISALEKEAETIDKNLQATHQQTASLSNEVSTLDNEIKQRELSINGLTFEIKKADSDITEKNQSIDTISQKIDTTKKALGASLFALYAYDKDNVFTALLKHDSLSDFLDAVNGVTRVESDIKTSVTKFQENQGQLQKEKTDLEQYQQDQQDLKTLQEVERKFLAQKKQEKDDLLNLTKGKESVFQQLLKSKKQDIASLKTQLFYLEKTGVTAEDAVQAADVAAKRAGIRTAFLLALLEVETGKQFEDGVISVGTNVGTGNWQTDLYNCYIHLHKSTQAETEKQAFLEITSKLNLNPDSMPVSRKPSYGCGGAMGPAQFLPSTWLSFEDRVAQLTSHQTPNPWNVDDAFTAAALFLADAGASSQDARGEKMAAKTYFSGKPTCAKYVCNTYANRVLSLARDIDQIL